MIDKILAYYLYAFTHLHRDKKNGGAPHKPVLLLSILYEYEAGRITNNQISITPELTYTFSSYWNQLVSTNHSKGFALPFYHLKSEKGNWWQLIPNLGCELWIENAGSMRSFGNLSAAIAYAQIDKNLADLLKNDQSRNLLHRAILDTYFPGKSLILSNQAGNYLFEVKREMLEESPAEYHTILKKLQTKLDPETYQIEIYTRDTIFRREIVRSYNDTCCITGIRVVAPFSFSMVDACHIVPFHKTFNNHPNNGIALCPNLHRAFDKGAISINDDYKVIVSSMFVENKEALYSFTRLSGIQIFLPRENNYYPSQESLAWHRKHLFKR